MAAVAARGARSEGLFVVGSEANAEFITALQSDWAQPAVIARLMEGATPTWSPRLGIKTGPTTTFFSLMNASLSTRHMLHAHEMAWQGLAAGGKQWVFLRNNGQVPSRNELELGRDVCKADLSQVQGEG